MKYIKTIDSVFFPFLLTDSRSQFRSLSTAVCYLLRKALPQTPLTINLNNPIPFSLDSFHSSPVLLLNSGGSSLVEETDELLPLRMKETGGSTSSLVGPAATSVNNSRSMMCARNMSDSMLNELTRSFQTLNMNGASLEETVSPLPSPKPSLSWFIKMDKGPMTTGSAPDVTAARLAKFDQFFPEIDAVINPSVVDKVNDCLSHSLSTPELVSPPLEEPPPFTRTSKSLPNMKPLIEDDETHTNGCVSTTTPFPSSLKLPTRVVVTEYLRTHSNAENIFCSSSSQPPTTYPLYKRPATVDRLFH